MDEELGILDEGFMYSFYESGNWFGFKPADKMLGWIGAGMSDYDFMVCKKQKFISTITKGWKQFFPST